VTAEISLHYERGRWRARGAALDVEHADLRALEELIAARLGEQGEQEAALRFDFGSLPAWLRQHQSHYFNYTLRFAPRRGGLASRAAER
jgi:hypothetical protein